MLLGQQLVERTRLKLDLIAHRRQQHQRGRRNAHGDGAGHPAGHAIRPRELWFADAQCQQGGEFEQNAGTGEQHVEHYQLAEGQHQAERPGRGAAGDGPPRCAGLRITPREDAGQKSVLGQRRRNTRQRHRERVERTRRAQHAAHRDPQRHHHTRHAGAEHGARHVGPGAGFPTVGVEAGQRHGADGQHVAKRHQSHRAGHRPRIGALRILDLARHRGRVVPAHVVPHRHQHAAQDVGVPRSRRPRGEHPAMKH